MPTVLERLLGAARRLDPAYDPDQARPLSPRVAGAANRAFDVLERYFRPSVDGLDNIPAGAALLVGNHNAGITFLEPFFLARAHYKLRGLAEPLYFLSHDFLVSTPVLGNLLCAVGCIRADAAVAGGALDSGQKVVVFPGGNYEAFRPFSERHKVDFGGKTGFARLALRHRVPVVPVLSLGGHETFFVLSRGEKLAHLLHLDDLVRSRACPVVVGLPFGVSVGPLFHLPLPARLEIEVGAPLDLGSPADADDPDRVAAAAARVERTLQEMMDRRAATRKLFGR